MLPRGQRIGKYVVESYIGQGGMAVVYRVRHAELNSVFALKLLTTTRPDIRDRMLAEGRYQAGLAHPNVVAVREFVQGRSEPIEQFADEGVAVRVPELYLGDP